MSVMISWFLFIHFSTLYWSSARLTKFLAFSNEPLFQRLLRFLRLWQSPLFHAIQQKRGHIAWNYPQNPHPFVVIVYSAPGGRGQWTGGGNRCHSILEKMQMIERRHRIPLKKVKATVALGTNFYGVHTLLEAVLLQS